MNLSDAIHLLRRSVSSHHRTSERVHCLTDPGFIWILIAWKTWMAAGLALMVFRRTVENRSEKKEGATQFLNIINQCFVKMYFARKFLGRTVDLHVDVVLRPGSLILKLYIVFYVVTASALITADFGPCIPCSVGGSVSRVGVHPNTKGGRTASTDYSGPNSTENNC